MHRWHRKRRISSRLRSWKTESLLFDRSINRLIVLIQICLFCQINIKLLKLHGGHNGASVISKCLLLLLNNLLCKIKIDGNKHESVSSGRSGSGCHGVLELLRGGLRLPHARGWIDETLMAVQRAVKGRDVLSDTAAVLHSRACTSDGGEKWEMAAYIHV